MPKVKLIGPVSPGEMLEGEFLRPLGMSKCRLAKSIAVLAQRIGDIVIGKRAITADTDLWLCRERWLVAEAASGLRYRSGEGEAGGRTRAHHAD
jgi:addiction module HigA family antidote